MVPGAVFALRPEISSLPAACGTIRPAILRFVEQLLAARHFDVLLPTHEQGFLFARVRERLKGRVGAGAAEFRKLPHRAQQGRLQPVARSVGFAAAADADRDVGRANCATPSAFRAVVKTSVGTASRGVWFVRDASDLEHRAARARRQAAAFADEVLVQDLIAGTTEKAQSVFCRGELIGFHAYRQVAAGVGGGEAIKESVSRPLRARLPRADRPASRLARRVVGRLHHAARQRHAAADRLQSAAGRADERLSRRHRSRRDCCFVSRLARRLWRCRKAAPACARILRCRRCSGVASRGGTRRDIIREGWQLLTGAGLMPTAPKS